jgi:hypothetical protein
MKYGFEDNKFFIDFVSCSRQHGTMREESDRRARDIAASGGKFMLGNSGGLDSQSVLHSFYTQGIPIETAFLYLPNYNDNEFEQVKIIDKKYGIKTHIIDLDPIACQQEIEDTALMLDITAKNNVIQGKFLSLLPSDYNFIQMVHDPFVYVHPKYNKFSYFQGYYLPEISRERAFANLNRKGKNIFYGDTPEFLLSIITDSIFKSALMSAMYFDGNGAVVEHKYLKTVDRWDFYIKPLMYGKYWGDELIYFPKFAGYERVNYLHGNKNFKKHAIMIDYYEFINFLNTPGSITKRYYENLSEDNAA